MGQGYKAIILAPEQADEKEIIRTWVDPHEHDNGYKLMEHSYIANEFVQAVEYLLSPWGMFYKSRVVWAGDYADTEAGLKMNLNQITDEESNEGKRTPRSIRDMSAYTYIVNHTLKQYTEKKENTYIHPLPLLTAEGNGRGGGDYRDTNQDLVGTWARHIISVEEEIPPRYTELVCCWAE